MRTLPKPLPGRLTIEGARRLWACVERRGENDCWPWKGVRRYGGGYPMFAIGSGRQVRVQRLLYESLIGPVGRRRVFTSCGSRACCNPAHLTLTPLNRGVAGAKHHATQLTDRDVFEICSRVAAGELQKDLATEYGVSFRTISAIWRGTAHKYAPRPDVKPRDVAAEVFEICARIRAGERQKDIAAEKGMSVQTISKIWHGRLYKNTPRPYREAA